MSLKKIVFYWGLVLIWMCVIFLFSSNPAQKSDNQSLFVIEMINKAANSLGFQGELLDDSWNYFIRKIAHGWEYAVLCMLLYLAVSALGFADKKLFLSALLICMLYAVTDEIHQMFVPGRAAKVMDVMIDTSGGFLGLVFMKIIEVLWHKKRIIRE
ncbi:MAG: VanZ family protein [Deltaproteobacteria bacterium]